LARDRRGLISLIDLLFLPLGALSAADVTTLHLLIETPTAQSLEPPAVAAGGLLKTVSGIPPLGETMYPGEHIKFEERTPGEERLFDYFWPANCAGAPPKYFRESVDLLKTVKNREAAVIARLRDYLTYVQDATLRNEIETLISTMEEKQLTKAKTKRKK
jgi:hypothetical protein